MAKPEEPHKWYFVESCDIDSTSGRRGKRHIRPCSGQGIPTTMLVRCPREMRTDFRLGTKFKIWGKLTDREGGENFLSSWHGYKYYHETEPGYSEDSQN